MKDKQIPKNGSFKPILGLKDGPRPTVDYLIRINREWHRKSLEEWFFPFYVFKFWLSRWELRKGKIAFIGFLIRKPFILFELGISWLVGLRRVGLQGWHQKRNFGRSMFGRLGVEQDKAFFVEGLPELFSLLSQP